MSDQFDALLETVLELREAQYELVPEAVVRELLRLHVDHDPSSQTVIRRAKEIIEAAVKGDDSSD